MKIDEWLKYASEKLRNSGIDTPNLDAEVLLSNSVNKDRSWLIGHSDQKLAESIELELDSKLKRRCLHEPIAYIRGSQEFYGRNFAVDDTVLVPRPESESIIALFNSLELRQNTIVADVGCGSGALGITAALEKSGNQIYFLDIDEQVFNIVSKNVSTHDIRNCFYFTGDLLAAHQTNYEVLLCNLPYVPTNYPLNKAAKYEPEIALYSGPDGIDHFKRLFEQLNTGKFGRPVVITESFPEQHELITKIANKFGWSLTTSDGFAQMFVYEN